MERSACAHTYAQTVLHSENYPNLTYLICFSPLLVGFGLDYDTWSYQWGLFNLRDHTKDLCASELGLLRI